MTKELLDEVLGFGPLEPLLHDPAVTDILVNGPFEVYIEKRGMLELSEARFRDVNHVMQVLDRIVTKVGRRVDESSPLVDARLPDGSRVNAVIFPIALRGPVISIRRFGAKPLQLDDLLRFKMFTPEMALLMEGCIHARLNVIISGGTGSGKTTLLNTLSAFIPNTDRIVTIEDAAELKLQQRHVVPLETRPPNIEGQGAITTRDLVRNALRMRPDRIVVGECRGGETLDMLQAMNTGHDGSLTTLHSNSARDALSRMETMMLMAGFEMPLKAMRQQMASAINVIIQVNRLQGGVRRVTSITEVVGMEGDVIIMQEIFRFDQTAVDTDSKAVGQFSATGVRPRFMGRIQTAGFVMPKDLFTEGILMSGI
ncbi:CpaF family protein [soil metagenome]